MSINHFSQDLQDTLWWRSQHPQQPPPGHHHQATWLNYSYSHPSHHGLSFNLNRAEDEECSELEEQVVDNMNSAATTTDYMQERDAYELEKEPLFEKPLTPSDVGKLNRLVIPKQHAEKYFPLAGESGDKGLLLSFEDESGKCWRFRYSYWSSSQSYVLTKGWSRYVKEKRLDAGDVILFERHRMDMDRLFIGWRRRGDTNHQDGGSAALGAAAQPKSAAWTAASVKRSGSTCRPYDARHSGHGPSDHGSVVQHQSSSTGGNSRTLRLFGVNMECQLDDSEPSTPDGSSLSSLGLGHQPMYNNSHSSHNYYSPNNAQYQMDVSFTQDVNHHHHQQHIRNRRG